MLMKKMEKRKKKDKVDTFWCVHKWWRSGQIAAHLKKESAPLRTLPVGVAKEQSEISIVCPFRWGM